MQHEPDVLVPQPGMAAGTTDDVFTTLVVVNQHSTIGASSYARNFRAMNPNDAGR